MGSSPHTRGAHLHAGGGLPRHRIIPAYAGSTPCGTAFREDQWDHPRIRGEHSTYKIGTLKVTGSSPHTRGAQAKLGNMLLPIGIIPAYAGSTAGAIGFGATAAGSSPHTRGALPPRAHRVPGDGIIPAYAGSTLAKLRWRRSQPDHPRIRGEHGSTARIRGLRVGSSPHTRGALSVLTECRSMFRIIPAYAGSTWVETAYDAGHADHPRIRGEHRDPGCCRCV